MELDEKEIGETLADWLVERRGLRPDMAKGLAKDVVESWGQRNCRGTDGGGRLGP